MKKIIPFVLFLGLLLGSANSIAQKKTTSMKWEKLGQKMVNINIEHDVIPVTIKDGVFSALKFKVLKAPVRIINIKVHYGNGTVENFPINRVIKAGGESKVFDLPGNKRIIKRISFNYKSVPTAKGRGILVAWGRH